MDMNKIKYWIQSKFRKRLKIDTLNAQYHDAMEELLHVNFQVLVDFIEDEAKYIKRINWSATEEHVHAYSEMQDLYNWWTKARPSRVDPMDDPDLVHPDMEFREMPNGDYLWIPWDEDKYPEFMYAMKEASRLDIEWWEEDQRNLHRLIDIRSFLWT